MKPITPVIPGLNLRVTIYAKDQDQYQNLPAYDYFDENNDKQVITRWKLNFFERIKILFFGNIFLTLLTFNNPLQPVKLSCKVPNIYK
jgi:hypothetical protein